MAILLSNEATGDQSSKGPLAPPATLGGISVKQVNIANAAVLTLNSAAVELVAAPGAGLILVPVLILIKHKFVTGAFTSTGNAQVKYGTSGLASTALTTVGLLDTTADALGVMSGPGMANAVATNVTNKNLSLTLSTAATVGGGSLEVTTFYRTIQV